MSVIINETCINCGACIDECPVEAIVDEDDNPTGEEIYYVYPDKCVESVLTTMMSRPVLQLVQPRDVLLGMQNSQVLTKHSSAVQTI